MTPMTTMRMAITFASTPFDEELEIIAEDRPPRPREALHSRRDLLTRGPLFIMPETMMRSSGLMPDAITRRSRRRP